MPRFACPSCKSVISVDVEQRGRVLACSSCGKKIRVPASKSSDAIQSEPAARVRKEAREAKPEAEEVRVTSKAPALARKKAPPRLDEEDGDETPLPPRSDRRRAVPRDEDEPEDSDEEGIADQDEEADADDDEGGGKKRRGKKKRRRKQSGGAVGVSGVLGSIGGLAAVALFILIISGPRWLTDFVEDKLVDSGIPPIVAGGIAILVLLIPLGLWIFLSFKGQILSAMPDDIDFPATKPSKFRKLDMDKLEEYTETFESLGFTPVFDYTVKTELENFPSGFARLFLNEEDGCYAEVNQGFAPDGESLPMRCTIVSHLEDDWSLTTTDRAPSAEIYLMRRPRALWRSLPDKEPDELLSHHLKMRKKMLRSLEVDLVQEISKEAYFKREKAANRDRKAAIRERWTAGLLIDYYFFDHNPKYEWRGEYVEAG